MPLDSLENFKTGHQQIVAIVDQVQVLARSYGKAKPHLAAMKEILLAHFGRQNNDFFDRLRMFHKDDPKAAKMVEFLRHDLKDIKVQFLAFFDKYTGEMNDSGSPAFLRDFAAFTNQVLARIKIEEEYLFPLL